MEQPPSQPSGQWSPDRMWWWNGTQWVPAAQAPLPPPPGPPYYYAPPSNAWARSPGLRPFLVVVLVIDALLVGMIALGGTLGVIGGANDAGAIALWLLFVLLLGLTVGAVVGVLIRAPWARLTAIAAGVGISLTCLGLILGIPIIVAAARAPLGKPSA